MITLPTSLCFMYTIQLYTFSYYELKWKYTVQWDIFNGYKWMKKKGQNIWIVFYLIRIHLRLRDKISVIRLKHRWIDKIIVKKSAETKQKKKTFILCVFMSGNPFHANILFFLYYWCCYHVMINKQIWFYQTD